MNIKITHGPNRMERLRSSLRCFSAPTYRRDPNPYRTATLSTTFKHSPPWRITWRAAEVTAIGVVRIYFAPDVPQQRVKEVGGEKMLTFRRLASHQADDKWAGRFESLRSTHHPRQPFCSTRKTRTLHALINIRTRGARSPPPCSRPVDSRK